MKRYITLLLIFLSITSMAQVQIAQIKTAEATFRQTRTSSVLAQPVTQTGTFKFATPDNICWKYDGMDNVQLPEQMLNFIRQAVSGNISSAQGEFETKWEGKTLILLPVKKQIKKFFTQIKIEFNSIGVATAVYLIEPSGDKTHIEFINMKYTTL